MTTAASESGESWGLWEGPDQPPRTGVFIAISESVLAGPQSLSGTEQAPLQTGEENSILLRLLDNLRSWPTASPASSPPSYTGDEPAGQEWAVLAVLAHELGHILFFDGNVDGRPGLERPVRKSNCFDTAFLGKSWVSSSYLRRAWVSFKDRNGSNHKSGRIKHLDEIDRQIRLGRYPEASDALRGVYGGQFASLFGSVSPDEDFVEIYKLLVLRAAGLARLHISFPISNERINVLTFLDGEVSEKADCISLPAPAGLELAP